MIIARIVSGEEFLTDVASEATKNGWSVWCDLSRCVLAEKPPAPKFQKVHVTAKGGFVI
jgi:hypothetical protein